MVIIRLKRLGVKNKPFYKIVATDRREKGTGPGIETLGFWQPSVNLKKINLKKIEEYTKNGAQISKAVKVLIGQN
ncbi:30S ribosomal protein S16 [Candidatus Woesebacteria bacterium]|nr:30S ribosomal protein S16 [Candidatus Woesebacteria bacterium]